MGIELSCMGGASSRAFVGEVVHYDVYVWHMNSGRYGGWQREMHFLNAPLEPIIHIRCSHGKLES
jgi:hypothetical protein